MTKVKCLDAWGKYSDIDRLLTTLVLWKSDDQSIAYMNPSQRDSNVTGVAVGDTNVTATLLDINGTAPVRVTDPDPVL